MNPFTKRWSALERAAQVLALLLVLAAAAFLARHVWRVFSAPTIDDAAISYSYALNLAQGHGLRNTPGSSPAEGFSNPIEVFLLSGFALFHADLDVAAKGINLAFLLCGLLGWGILIAWRAKGFGRVFAPLLCLLPLLWPTFNYWTVAGLENGILAGLLSLSVLCLLLAPESRGWDIGLGAVAGLLAWARPEAGIYGALVIAPRLLVPRRRGLALAIFLSSCLLLFAFRFICFRDFVPNTFWVKVSPEHPWKAGMDYAKGFLGAHGIAYGLCLVPLAAFLSRKTLLPLLAAVVQIAFVLFFVAFSGGDWMKQWRFMQFVEGPFIALLGLGLYAMLVPERSVFRFLPKVLRIACVAGLAAPILWVNRPLGKWEERAKAAGQPRDLDMRKIAICASYYRELGEKLHLGRPLLEADIDVGGMAYPAGLDVLDLAGLTDRVLGRAWSRNPAVLVDYIYGERRPDTIHLHGGWLGQTPVHALWPFHDQYRVMGPGFLYSLRLGPLSAVRADLVDPPIRPVKLQRARIGSVEVEGAHAFANNGDPILSIQAVQVLQGAPTQLAWSDANGKSWPISWHGGFDVAAGPVGSSLLGASRIKGAQLPLHLQTSLELEMLPLTTVSSATWIDAARLPLARMAGLSLPSCDVDILIDRSASLAARARGTALLADLCGSALSPSSRLALARNLGHGVRELRDPDDRFDTLSALASLGIGLSTSQRMSVEEARRKHQAYDEILMAWAEWELAQELPKGNLPQFALWLWLEARQYGRVLLTSLANNWDSDPAAVGPICAAVRALGIRQSSVGISLDCGQAKVIQVMVRRQSFEAEEDRTLHLLGAGKDWITAATNERMTGGQGLNFLASRGTGTAKLGPGEVVWGPLPWPGQRFGLLMAGTASGLSVGVEVNESGVWKEVAHASPPSSGSVMTPQIMLVPGPSTAQVRVRVISKDHKASTLVDALTFIDFKEAR
jgi:hypothetical protein